LGSDLATNQMHLGHGRPFLRERHTMSEYLHIRINVSMATAKEILERLGVPEGAEYPDALSKAAYLVLEAIYQAETALAEYAVRFLCPQCFHEYKIHVSLRGRNVRCVKCGHRWRAPDVIELN